MQNYNSYHQLRFNKGCLNEEIGDVIKITSALQCWEQFYKKFTTVIYYPIKITVVTYYSAANVPYTVCPRSFFVQGDEMFHPALLKQVRKEPHAVNQNKFVITETVHSKPVSYQPDETISSPSNKELLDIVLHAQSGLLSHYTITI
jgi:hypothetical protein